MDLYLPAVLSWMATRLIKLVMARTRAGDLRLAMMMDADEIRFVFPGDNSWSGEYRGKAARREWLERFVRQGVKTEADEVIVGGFPWNMRVCIRGRSWVDASSGERVYENRFVIWAKLRWGKAYEEEVYEDTVKPRALDQYLAAKGDERAAALVGAPDPA